MDINLEIASFRICLHPEAQSEILLGERFSAFMSSEDKAPDLIVNVYSGQAQVPLLAVKMFEAPLMEETYMAVKNSGTTFWNVCKAGEDLYIKALLREPEREPMLFIPEKGITWHLFADCRKEKHDHLPYPLDGLMLYYLALKHGAFIIHGSGVISEGQGWLFSGKSGKGKTTLAKIFDSCGDMVIHDDRLILVKSNSGWVMHNTPVYRNEEPRSTKVDHIWMIDHGRSNISTPVSGAEAAGLVLANCIQQNWDSESTLKLVSVVEDLTKSVSVSRLKFKPDSSVRDYLLVRENEAYKVSSAVASSILDQDKAISIAAGGYSMWPVIRPGDKVIVTPLAGTEPETGDIVALIRDGGFVVHRVIEIKKENGFSLFRTRGDASAAADPWMDITGIKGLVKNIIRSGKTLSVRKKPMPVALNRITAFFASVISLFKGNK